MRDSVMQDLGQPNPRADEPWPVDGDFAVGGFSFLALGPHHTEGEFWQPMIQQAIAAGAEEITEAEYKAARPQPEEYPS